ncbi:MAG: DMT family transporter [Synechococcales cyanobacterium RM1_1_8]|nr:DMT family transporter [Synechococcales cyanobacterium RM1_1_8]
MAAALLWAVAAVVFARLGDRVAPLVLNLVKGLVAIALLLLTLLLLQRPFPRVEGSTVVYLLLSGALGIGLGDSFYFRALALIGARRSLLLESLSPALAALLALVFLQETLSWTSGVGMALTLGGVAWVVSERQNERQLDQGNGLGNSAGNGSSDGPSSGSSPGPGHSPGNPPPKPGQRRPPARLALGLGYGCLAALGQAGGAVLSRAGLAETAMDPLWSTLLRLVSGTGLVLLWLPFAARSALARRAQRSGPMLPPNPLPNQFQPQPQPPKPASSPPLQLPSLRLLGTIAVTAFFSTYLAIWLQQTALKSAATGIAQALTSTSPLFILPIARLLGERISARAWGGVLISLLGIFLLFQG